MKNALGPKATMTIAEIAEQKGMSFSIEQEQDSAVTICSYVLSSDLPQTMNEFALYPTCFNKLGATKYMWACSLGRLIESLDALARGARASVHTEHTIDLGADGNSVIFLQQKGIEIAAHVRPAGLLVFAVYYRSEQHHSQSKWTKRVRRRLRLIQPNQRMKGTS